MAEQVKRLEAFFKRRQNNPEEEVGDDNTCREQWEFQEPEEVKLWSIELDKMTGWTHFVHKFKKSTLFLPISFTERVKDVLYKRPGIVLIHCVTTDVDAYMFTLCIEYAKNPFDLTVFLKSLKNTPYEKLMKEIEDSVDKMEWMTKEGLPLNAKSMASKLRQTVISLDVVTATNRNIAEKMREIELTGHLTS